MHRYKFIDNLDMPIMEPGMTIRVRPIITSIVLVTTLLVVTNYQAFIESAALNEDSLQDSPDAEAKAQVSMVILGNNLMRAGY